MTQSGWGEGRSRQSRQHDQSEAADPRPREGCHHHRQVELRQDRRQHGQAQKQRQKKANSPFHGPTIAGNPDFREFL